MVDDVALIVDPGEFHYLVNAMDGFVSLSKKHSMLLYGKEDLICAASQIGRCGWSAWLEPTWRVRL